jgi:C-terminal processing protease CtpA/Prc
MLDQSFPRRLPALLCALLLPLLAAGADHSPEVIRADFDELYARLRDSHYDLYARRSKDDYDRLFAKVRASFSKPLDATEVAIRLQPFVAFGRIAHARIDFPRQAFESWRQAGGRLFPLELRVVDGRPYITQNWSGEKNVTPGDEIVSVGDSTAAAWLEKLTGHLSADNLYMAHTMLEWSLQRLVWLESGGPASMPMRVRRPDGSQHTVSIPFMTQAEIDTQRKRQPPAFELSWDAREHRMLDGGIAYLRPGPFYDAAENAPNPWDPREFSAFIDRAFTSFAPAGATALLIDLRDNAGGDNSFSDLMLNWFATRPYRFASRFQIKVSEAAIAANRKRLELAGNDPDATSAKLAAAYSGRRPGELFDFDIPLAQPRRAGRFAGKVFVLINRHSYSNTVMVAATVQDYGFATVLGEETSDLATTYGAMEELVLSRTGVKVGFPKARIVRPSGALEARGVIPDIAIPTPVVPTQEDVVLQQAARIIEARLR